MSFALAGEHLAKTFGGVDVVVDATIEVRPGEFVALLGPSGSGKTTLLHMLGLLDRPTQGRVLLGGADAWATGDAERSRLRLQHVGFVFQDNNLLPHLTCAENVALPAWRLLGDERRAFAAADGLLERLGLGSHRDRRASVLSRGEAQRVAIARALVNRPLLVLADEPTGSLDAVSAQHVEAALRGLNETGTAVVVVTHNADLAAAADRVVHLHRGVLNAANASAPLNAS